MTVIVQNDDGDVADANAYVSVADFKAYHDARGNSYAGKTDPQIGQAIIRATDYLEQRFAFRGVRLTSTQTTEFPRKAGAALVLPWLDVDFLVPVIDADPQTDFTPLVDLNGNDIIGIPVAIKRASFEYAIRALSILLFQDAPAPEGGRQIDEHSVRVDVISETTRFSGSQAGGFALPAFPTADLWLARAGLIEIGRTITR